MQQVGRPGNSRIRGDFPGDGGPWEAMENRCLGRSHCPHPSLTQGDALASSNKPLIEHLLCANHLAPITPLSLQQPPIHRDLPLLGINPAWHRAQRAGEAREPWSRCEEGQRRERTFSTVSLVMLTAHKPLSLKTNNNYNPQHQRTLAGLLCTQGSGREQAACTGLGARRAVSCSRLCPGPCGTLHKGACPLASKMG